MTHLACLTGAHITETFGRVGGGRQGLPSSNIISLKGRVGGGRQGLPSSNIINDSGSFWKLLWGLGFIGCNGWGLLLI